MITAVPPYAKMSSSAPDHNPIQSAFNSDIQVINQCFMPIHKRFVFIKNLLESSVLCALGSVGLLPTERWFDFQTF